MSENDDRPQAIDATSNQTIQYLQSHGNFVARDHRYDDGRVNLVLAHAMEAPRIQQIVFDKAAFNWSEAILEKFKIIIEKNKYLEICRFVRKKLIDIF